MSLGYDRIVLDKSFSDVKLDTISEGWQLSIGIGVGLNWYHLGDSYTRIKMIKENGVYISPDQRVWIE